jgi:subtilisin family serine protease
VRVAVVDTGVDTNHPDLTDRVVKTVNFVEGGEKTFTADYHGTAVAGVIGARADNGIGIYGIAPEADLLAVKACWHRRTGIPEAWCSSWTLAKAIDFAIVERVRVLNLSLSGPPDPLLRRLIVKAVEEQGITVVAAVMEQGDPALSFPSSLSTVIAVVASDSQGNVRAHAGKHPALLAAPGIEVLTTVPNGAYDFLSGSSFATAHVSGIVALLLEGNPQLSPREVRNLLIESGRPVNRNDPETVSIRHVDACEALRRVVRESCS